MFSRLRSKLGELRENVRQMRDRPAAPSPSPSSVVARPAAPVASTTAPSPTPAPASGSLAARAAALANGAAPAVTPPAPAEAEAPAGVTAAPAAPPPERTETPAEPTVAAEPPAAKAPKAGKAPKTRVAPEAEPTAAKADGALDAAPPAKAEAAPVVKAETEPVAKADAAPKAAASAKAEPKAAAKTDGAASKLHADTASTTLEAYIARAKANNRDLSTITGGEGRNVAVDGVAYEGPVDNESSRAKAAGKVLTIDQWECISCGTCVEQTEHVFFLPSEEDAKATPIAQEGPMDLIQDAIDACPVTCISWTSKEEAEERGLATGEGWTAPT
jgi:ferredoxin